MGPLQEGGLFKDVACNVTPCQYSLSFAACLILGYLRKTQLKSNKTFVEHALHVARMQFRTQA